MNGKVIEFKPRCLETVEAGSRFSREEILDRLQPEAGQMERSLQQEISRAPEMIKDSLVSVFNKGRRQCPLLFLAICKLQEKPGADVCRLAASLELLSMALEVHCGFERYHIDLSSDNLLAGDFLFSQALILAAGHPVFIEGMSEVISGAAAAGVNKPSRKPRRPNWKGYLLQRIASQQASVTALSGSLGSWYANYPSPEIELYTYFGYCLGMTLHIKRELLFAEQQLRQAAPRLAMSLPLAWLLEKSPWGAELEQVFYSGQCTPRQQEILIEEWERTKPGAGINTICQSYYQKAESALAQLSKNPGYKLLNSLLDLSANDIL
ncbi:MAG TPA: hypothetical protein GX693_03730 [Firmicutes bacterium]|nr:hypothetical protein [Bacillota bacterium]